MLSLRDYFSFYERIQVRIVILKRVWFLSRIILMSPANATNQHFAEVIYF